MATGKPIVSSAVPDVVTNFGSVVKIAATHDDFIVLCRRALKKPDTAAIAAGLEMALANSWDSIVAKLEEHIADAIGQAQLNEAVA